MDDQETTPIFDSIGESKGSLSRYTENGSTKISALEESVRSKVDGQIMFDRWFEEEVVDRFCSCSVGCQKLMFWIWSALSKIFQVKKLPNVIRKFVRFGGGGATFIWLMFSFFVQLPLDVFVPFGEFVGSMRGSANNTVVTVTPKFFRLNVSETENYMLTGLHVNGTVGYFSGSIKSDIMFFDLRIVVYFCRFLFTTTPLVLLYWIFIKLEYTFLNLLFTTIWYWEIALGLLNPLGFLYWQFTGLLALVLPLFYFIGSAKLRFHLIAMCIFVCSLLIIFDSVYFNGRKYLFTEKLLFDWSLVDNLKLAGYYLYIPAFVVMGKLIRGIPENILYRARGEKFKKAEILKDDLDVLIAEKKVELIEDQPKLRKKRENFIIDRSELTVLEKLKSKIIGDQEINLFLAEWSKMNEKVMYHQYPVRNVEIGDVYLERELSILSNFFHPNCLRFYGVTLGHRLGIITEYCQPGNIQEFLKKYHQLNERLYPQVEKIRIFRQLASAMVVLHSNLVVHRNICPENVLIDKEFNCKLSGFEFSKTLQEHVRDHTRNIGLELYQSPEIFLRGEYSTKGDIYAFGVLLYTSATEDFNPSFGLTSGGNFRQLPFEESSLISPRVKKVLRGCLGEDPSTRPTMKEIYDLLSEPSKEKVADGNGDSTETGSEYTYETVEESEESEQEGKEEEEEEEEMDESEGEYTYETVDDSEEGEYIYETVEETESEEGEDEKGVQKVEVEVPSLSKHSQNEGKWPGSNSLWKKKSTDRSTEKSGGEENNTLKKRISKLVGKFLKLENQEFDHQKNRRFFIFILALCFFIVVCVFNIPFRISIPLRDLGLAFQNGENVTYVPTYMTTTPEQQVINIRTLLLDRNVANNSLEAYSNITTNMTLATNAKYVNLVNIITSIITVLIFLVTLFLFLVFDKLQDLWLIILFHVLFILEIIRFIVDPYGWASGGLNINYIMCTTMVCFEGLSHTIYWTVWYVVILVGSVMYDFFYIDERRLVCAFDMLRELSYLDVITRNVVSNLVLIVFILCLYYSTRLVPDENVFDEQKKVVESIEILKDDLDILVAEKKAEILDDLSFEWKFTKQNFRIEYSDIKILRLIDTGGVLCSVYKVEWSGNICCLKEFEARKANVISVFEREVSIISSVSHIYLVKFYGAVIRPRLGIVIEFCENGNLRSFLRQYKKKHRKRYPMKEKLRLFSQIVSGLSHLHGLNIIHRDVKCENTLVTLDVDIRICDFGLSRMLYSGENTRGAKTKYIGTSFYMSPEITLGSIYSAKTDIYSLAILFYMCITENWKPFDKNVTQGIELLIAMKKLRPKIRDHDFSSCPFMKDLVQRCWDHTPAERPSAQDILDIMKENSD